MAVAAEQSGRARMVMDAAARATKERRIAARRMALASRVGSIPTLMLCHATRLVARGPGNFRRIRIPGTTGRPHPVVATLTVLPSPLPHQTITAPTSRRPPRRDTANVVLTSPPPSGFVKGQKIF